MPYRLSRESSGAVNGWLLETTDAVAATRAADYIVDAGPTELETGRGMIIGDRVWTVQRTALTDGHSTPGDILEAGWSYVSEVKAPDDAADPGKGTLAALV